MSSQPELFPTRGAGFTPDPARPQPAVWVRELLLLREFKPGESHEIRRVKLRPGLNILWARPRSSPRPKLGEAGVYGHASGKTTFCRLLRHVLGEEHFGNSDLQSRIRSHFRGGWVVGEIMLAGEPWLVCRPFTLGSHPFVIRGASVDRLFEPGLKREPLQAYTDELNRVLMEPLPVATFATAPEPIEWPHLIQWLARDQECRFAGLTDFRHKSSESDSPDMDVEDRHVLFRAVVGLIDAAEQEELERNQTLVVQKTSAERRVPLLRHQARVAFERLRGELPELHADQAGELFLEAARNSLKQQEGDLTRQAGNLKEPPELADARRRLTDALVASKNAADRVNEIEGLIEDLRKVLQNLRGEITNKELNDYLAKKNEGSKLCLEPLAKALAANCPLAFGKSVPVKPGQAASQIERKADDLAEDIKLQEKHLATAAANARQFQQQAEKIQIEVNERQRSFDEQRSKLFAACERVRSLIRDALRAKEDEDQAATLEKSIVSLDKEMRKSQEQQGWLRKAQARAVSEFSGTFNRVAKAILGVEVEAKVHFDGRLLAAKMEHRGDLTSAAIDTIKILAFDLAALISSVEGRGFHPRLLVHDGPREADMAADLYQKVFLLAHELELAFGKAAPSFQYVVTTTEPPPEDLQGPPTLLDPILDASKKEGRLFKEDL